MKKHSTPSNFPNLCLLLLCCALHPFNTKAQCPTNISFTSQGQIDSFAINYPGCTQIPGKMTIAESDSASITNLDSLYPINYIYSLNIYNNAALTSLRGLDSLTSIGRDLSLFNNASLTSLNGLNNLISIGELYVSYCTSLTSLSSLERLTTVGNNLFIDNIPALTSLSGLDSLNFVGGTLLLYRNVELKNVDALGNLTSVGGVLDLGYNDALTSLGGLSNLTSVGGGLSVYYNSSLTSLSGLDNMDFSTIITGILIDYNPQLVVCNVKSICDYLENGGFATIYSNAPGCNNMSQVKAACAASLVESPITGQWDVKIVPNVTNGIIYVENGENRDVRYRFLDTRGRLMLAGRLENNGYLDISSFSSGLYYLELSKGNQSTIKKIIKTE